MAYHPSADARIGRALVNCGIAQMDRKVKLFRYYAGLVKQNEDEAKKALKALPPVSGGK